MPSKTENLIAAALPLVKSQKKLASAIILLTDLIAMAPRLINLHDRDRIIAGVDGCFDGVQIQLDHFQINERRQGLVDELSKNLKIKFKCEEYNGREMYCSKYYETRIEII